jgi:hypothetical protein
LVTRIANTLPNFLERLKELQKLMGSGLDLKVQIGHALFNQFVHLAV